LVVTRQLDVLEKLISIEEAEEENSKRSALLTACFLLGLHFGTEDEGYNFVRTSSFPNCKV
jgi:hypothetical protein